MELSWIMKLRIAAAAAVGIVLVSIVAWPYDNPPDPFGTLLFEYIGLNGAVTLLIMSFLAGLIAYFVTWPYGLEIGILAVPFGLSIWAVRTGSVASLVQLNPALTQRQSLFAALRLEPIFWLAVVIAGFAGVTLGYKIRPGYKYQETKGKSRLSRNKYLNPIISLGVVVLLTQFCLKILAQDVMLSDNRLGSIVAQPAVGQIVFAIFVSFGIAAFVIKRYLEVGYIWSIIGSAFVTAFSIMLYVKPNQLDTLVELWPAVFFPNAVVAILPIQMVVFGTLGSISGYWMAVRYQYWREHELK